MTFGGVCLADASLLAVRDVQIYSSPCCIRQYFKALLLGKPWQHCGRLASAPAAAGPLHVGLAQARSPPHQKHMEI